MEPDLRRRTQRKDLDPLSSHLSAGTRQTVLDRPAPRLLLAPSQTQRLSQTSMSRRGRRSSSPRLPPRLFTTYDLQHIITPTQTRPLLSVQRETDTYASLPVSWRADFNELASLKRAQRKCVFVGLIFLLSLFFFFHKKR